MKKWLVYGLALLWLAALVQFVLEGKNYEDPVMEAFRQESLGEQKCTLCFRGQYEGPLPSDEEREALFVQLAQSLGITEGYALGWYEEDDRESLVLLKEGRYGDTQMVWTVLPEPAAVYEGEQQAVSLKITLHQEAPVLRWQEQIGVLCKEAGFSGQTDFCVEGSWQGNLSPTQRDRAAAAIFVRLGAREVSASRTETLYTVYGHTDRIDRTWTVGGERVNVNLAMYYDEKADRTVVLVGSPVLQEDF